MIFSVTCLERRGALDFVKWLQGHGMSSVIITRGTVVSWTANEGDDVPWDVLTTAVRMGWIHPADGEVAVERFLNPEKENT